MQREPSPEVQPLEDPSNPSSCATARRMRARLTSCASQSDTCAGDGGPESCMLLDLLEAVAEAAAARGMDSFTQTIGGDRCAPSAPPAARQALRRVHAARAPARMHARAGTLQRSRQLPWHGAGAGPFPCGFSGRARHLVQAHAAGSTSAPAVPLPHAAGTQLSSHRPSYRLPALTLALSRTRLHSSGMQPPHGLYHTC